MAATLERLEQRQDQMLDRMDRRFDAIDRKFELIDRKFESIDRRYDLLTVHHRQDLVLSHTHAAALLMLVGA